MRPENADQTFTLRISVRTLEQAPIAELESPRGFDVLGVPFDLEQRDSRLILSARGFASPEMARTFAARLKAGLWNVSLEHGIAFSPEFEERQVHKPADPESAGRNLSASFGLPNLGPVHGLTEEGGTTIFPSGDRVRFLSGEGSGPFVPVPFDQVTRTLSLAIKNSRAGEATKDERLATAFDLFIGHLYETTIRAQFLTLMMVLEVLAPVTKGHHLVQKLISKWHEEIMLMRSQTTESDSDARDALDALKYEIHYRKETSKRRRVRQLILDEAPLDWADKESLAKKVVEAYDLRGVLVHNGWLVGRGQARRSTYYCPESCKADFACSTPFELT